MNSDQFEFMKNNKNKKPDNIIIPNKEIETLSSISDRRGNNTLYECEQKSKKIIKKTIPSEDEYSILNSSKINFLCRIELDDLMNCLKLMDNQK
jgi:hypothetical protein